MWDEVPGSIAVGVDYGGGSINAVRFAAREAQRQGVELSLVHVVPDLGAIAPPYYVPPNDLQLDMDKRGRELLTEATATATAAAPGVPCTRVLRTGPTVSTLVEVTREARMIVLGHETVTPPRRIFTGAVTMGVSARARVAVVSVPADWNPGTGAAKVVAGFKSSRHSAELLASAFAEASARHARLVLVHAWALSSIYDDRIVTRTRGEEWSQAARAGIEPLIAGHRAQYPGVEVDLRIVHDQAAHALLHEAQDAGLLVLVRRAHGFPPATHLGGTARSLLAKAPCPVMVLPPREVVAEVEDLRLESAGAPLK
jgi:nucleotide-binding universal stress UspA family protein